MLAVRSKAAPRKNMEMDIEIECTRSAGPSETLDQGNCASLGDLSRKSGLLAKMGGDAAIDDAKQD